MTLLNILAPLCLAALQITVTSAQELRRSGFIGVSATALTDEARKQLPPNASGILVQAVVDGGSARDSGIQPNDIITQVNDHKVIDVNDFVQTVKTLRAGSIEGGLGLQPLAGNFNPQKKSAQKEHDAFSDCP